MDTCQANINGTDKDEQIILTNHTDGPSITQDNGALGILGIIKYFSNIPQEKEIELAYLS